MAFVYCCFCVISKRTYFDSRHNIKSNRRYDDGVRGQHNSYAAQRQLGRCWVDGWRDVQIVLSNSASRGPSAIDGVGELGIPKRTTWTRGKTENLHLFALGADSGGSGGRE